MPAQQHLQTPFERWFAVIAVSIGSFSSLLSSTTIDVAFSPLMHYFSMSMTTAQWTITLYMIIMTIAMLLAADLVKRIGIKATSTVSFTFFITGCYLGGSAESIEALFAGRLLQGLGAGLQTPLAAIVVTKSFPKERIGFAMGIFGSVMLLAPALGPVVGGLLIDLSNWRILFYFQLPLALFSLLAGRAALPKGEISAQGRYDWPGLALIAGFICSLFAAMNQYRDAGVGAISFQLALGGAVLALWLFIHNEGKAKNPLVDLTIFAITPFSLNLVIIFMLGAGMFSSILLIPFYLIETLGYSPGEAGMALLPAGIVMAVSAPIAGKMADRFSPAKVIVPSLLVFASSGWFLSCIELDATIGYIVVGALLSRIGLSFLLPSLYASTLRHLNGQYTEYGSSLMNFARQLGGSVGVMLFSSKFAEYAQHHQLLVDTHHLQASFTKYQAMISQAFYTLSTDLGSSQQEPSRYWLEQLASAPKQVSEYVAFTNIFYLVAIAALSCVGLWLASFALSKRHSQAIEDSPAQN